MSQRTQVSVKDLASFKLAAEQSGTSLESVGKAIQRLNLSVSQAATDKGMAESLRNLGITSTDARERLFQLADAYAKSGGQGRQLADMQKVLSKSYADTLPLLSQGSQALRDSAIAAGSYSDAMAKLAPDADKFNDELARMKINSAGAGAAILTDIVPPMADWLGSVNVLIERYGVLTGVLAGIGAAAVPGITAGDLAGDVSVSAFKRQLEDAKDELKTIEAATKSGTFGLIQLALYGSEADMRRKGEYLRGNIKTLEESIHAEGRDGRDGRHQVGVAITVRQGFQHVEHRRVQGRLAHAGELDLELGGSDDAAGEPFRNHVVDLHENFIGGRFAAIASTGIAEQAFHRAAEEGGDHQNPTLGTRIGRLARLHELDQASLPHVRHIDGRQAGVACSCQDSHVSLPG
jgi:hypothetical protein